MTGEIGPVIQRLRSEQWAGEPGRGWRTYRLQVAWVFGHRGGSVADAVNDWLAEHPDALLIAPIQAFPETAAAEACAFVQYYERVEEVAADGAGGE